MCININIYKNHCNDTIVIVPDIIGPKVNIVFPISFPSIYHKIIFETWEIRVLSFESHPSSANQWLLCATEKNLKKGWKLWINFSSHLFSPRFFQWFSLYRLVGRIRVDKLLWQIWSYELVINSKIPHPDDTWRFYVFPVREISRGKVHDG